MAADKALALLCLSIPRVAWVGSKGYTSSKDYSLISCMNLVNLCAKVRVVLRVYSERPVRHLIEVLNENSL